MDISVLDVLDDTASAVLALDAEAVDVLIKAAVFRKNVSDARGHFTAYGDSAAL